MYVSKMGEPPLFCFYTVLFQYISIDMWGGSSPGGRGAPDELAVALRGGLGRWCVTV